MRKYLFLGDVHADVDFLEQALTYAHDNDVHDVVQVGDFGMIWTPDATMHYISTLVQRYDITLRWICGNHENHVRIREQCDALSMACETLPGGGYEFSSRVIYQPRGSHYVDEDGTTFLFCGGAPSIDWLMRTPGKSWWPEEVISEEEFERTLAFDGKVDVLVTHDAPQFPPGFGPKGDPGFRGRGARSMEMIAALVAEYEPALLVHGHWHSRYSSEFWNTRVEGLDCNFARFEDAVMMWSRA